MDARLKVVGGSYSGRTIPIPRGKLVIGREEDCDLRLVSEFVSGYHCVLLLDDYTVRIRDLGSKNGTFLNGRRIGTGERILLHDDTVSVDKVTFQMDLTEASTGEPPAVLQGTGFFDGETVHLLVPAIPSRNPAASIRIYEADVEAEYGTTGLGVEQPVCVRE